MAENIKKPCKAPENQTQQGTHQLTTANQSHEGAQPNTFNQENQDAQPAQLTYPTNQLKSPNLPKNNQTQQESNNTQKPNLTRQNPLRKHIFSFSTYIAKGTLKPKIKSLNGHARPTFRHLTPHDYYHRPMRPMTSTATQHQLKTL